MAEFHNIRMKSNASIISVVQRFSDISIMLLGLYIACKIDGVYFYYMQWLTLLGALAVFQMLGGITDFYRSWRGVKFSAELQLLLQNWTLSLILISGIISLLIQKYDIDLNIKWYGMVTIGLIAARFSIRVIIGLMRKIGYNTRNIAFAGNMQAGINLANDFINQPWLGFRVVGIYDNKILSSLGKINYGGNFDTLIEHAKCGKIDRVFISMPMTENLLIRKVIDDLTDTTCSVMLIPDIFTFNILQSRTEEINGVPLVSLFDTPMSGINSLLKRLEDIILSLMIIVLIAPALLFIAIAIKMTSPGPVIFRQVRYGMDGKQIKVWKFRSMNVMEDGAVVTQAKKNDNRVTPLGSFLRRTSLDELPQFINVLSGDMSIVGPRPHAVAHNEQYRLLIKGYMLRHKMKPGITGWAQINGWRGETDTLDKMEKRVEFDLEYIRNWSIWLDAKIIFLTIFRGFMHTSAY